MSRRNTSISQEQLEKVKAPFETARPLPAAAYRDQEFYEVEKEHIFSKHWVSVIFDFDVPEPGQVLPFEYCDMPLLAVRGSDSTLRIFHNVVPYDGCLAVLEPSKGLEKITTPYHGWVYDLKGKLIEAPFWDGTPEGSLDSVAQFETDLIEINARIFFHTVFINLSDEPSSFEDHVAPVYRQFAEYDFDQAVIAVDELGKPIVVEAETNCNWKIFFDIDGPNVLHEGFVHKDYINSPLHPRVNKDGQKTYREIIDGYLVGLGFNRSDFTETYGVVDPSKPHLGRDGVLPDAAGFIDLYPALSLSIGPSYTEIAINLPNGVDKTFDRRIYLLPAVVDNEGTGRGEGEINFHSEVAPEDNIISEALQKAAHSPVYTERFFSPFWDRMRYEFHKWVATDVT